MKKKSVSFIIAFFIYTYIGAQNIEISKSTGELSNSEQSFLYALPQTSITLTVEVTKTTIVKGPYAEYAAKYLKLSNVPMADSHFWSVSDIRVAHQTEADPSQTYIITFKKFPEQLKQLFSLSNNGLILDFANAWNTSLRTKISAQTQDLFFDPLLTEETVKEKVDTFYKTVMTDSSFVRIPVFKKQIQAKTAEEIIGETAHELIKTRKRKLKILRGEYDFHPDGSALKVMIEELTKYENQLLQMFAGKKLTEKQYYTFTIVPQPGGLTKDICYFNEEKGIQQVMTPNSAAITIQLTKEQEPAKSIIPEKAKNVLYFRAPIMAGIAVKLGEKNIVTTRLPVYQFGPLLSMPIK